MIIKNILLLLLLINIVIFQSTSVSAGSCQHGRAACIGSCIVQNCASGHCPDGPTGVCVCIRCQTGPNIPWPH